MALDFNELFNDSYEYVQNNNREFFDLFYLNFTNSSPLIEKAFKNTNMENQKAMLETAITHMVMFFTSKRASKYLIDTASLHKERYQIDFILYELFLDSLINTLEKFDPNFNNQTAVAWRITLAPGIEFMKHINIQTQD